MNVGSCFDGQSCGQITFDKLGIKFDGEKNKYFASEIKQSAMKVTNKNYPNTIQLGDITKLTTNDFDKIDILIGGSPCQDFSQLKVNGKGLEGDKSKLFYEFLRLLRQIKPKYFLLENVKMKPEYKKELDAYLGVKGININSNLVTFQNRNRWYWTNIPGITIPKDKNISFQDFKDVDYEYCKQFKVKDTPSRRIMWGNGINGKCPNVTTRKKINCLTRKQDRWSNSGLVEFDGFCRYLTRKELEAAQTIPIGYTDCLSYAQAQDVLGDGWTVDVITHIFSFIPEIISGEWTK